jgi:hypothetical protein
MGLPLSGLDVPHANITAHTDVAIEDAAALLFLIPNSQGKPELPSKQRQALHSSHVRPL